MVKKISLFKAKNLITPKLLSISGIVGVGLNTVKKNIRVYVEKLTPKLKTKIPLEIEKFKIKIPKEYGIEIIESGRIYALSRTDKWRPAPGGVSIGHFDITAGTLGCIAIDNLTNRRVILSNNHILANSDTVELPWHDVNKGDVIYQPGPYDRGSSEDTIARLERWVKINKWTAVNIVDCAIATPINDYDISNNIMEIGEIEGTSDPIEDMDVQKSGRTTGLTTGKILDANLTVNVGFEFGLTTFEDCIWISENFVSGGDSGSAICNGKNIVGLVFAGNDYGNCVGCKIKNVVNQLNISFPIPPLIGTSTLNVNSNPKEALIYLDDIYIGQTNHSYKIRAGTHRLKVTKHGYDDYTETFSISEGQIKTSNISLISYPIPTLINVNSTPIGANIYLDDVYIGKTNYPSYEIAPGNHTLKLTLKDYFNKILNFIIYENETLTFNITLEGCATINVINPLGASIYLNSRVTETPFPEYAGIGIYGEPDYIGNTDVSIPVIPTGGFTYRIKNFEYILTAMKKNYQVYKEKFTISLGEIKTFNINNLIPISPGDETIDQESVFSEAETKGENCRPIWNCCGLPEDIVFQTFKPSLPRLTKIELRCRNICGNCLQYLYLYKGSTFIEKVGVVPEVTQGGGMKFSPTWTEFKFVKPITVTATEYRFRIKTDIVFLGGPLISYDNPYLQGTCSDGPETDLKFRTYGLFSISNIKFYRISYKGYSNAGKIVNITTIIRNYGDDGVAKLELVNRDTGEILNSEEYFLSKYRSKSFRFKLIMPGSAKLPTRFLKLRLNLYEGNSLKQAQDIDIKLEEGIGHFIIASYPASGSYNEKIKIYVTYKNIGEYRDTIFWRIVDNNTDEILTTYRKSLYPGRESQNYKYIKMPNKNLNFRVEVGHKEGKIYIIEETSPIYVINLK